MKKETLWKTFSEQTFFPTLTKRIEVDVVIIGGGICGISCAQLLSQRGFTVALLESGKIGEGNTGYSSGNIYQTVGVGLSELSKKHGHKSILNILDSRQEAIRHIKENIFKYQIECDFEEVPINLFSALPIYDELIQSELSLAKKYNLKYFKNDLKELPFPISESIKQEKQIQLNPIRYVQGLANSIFSDDCHIFENTTVIGIEEGVDNHLVNAPFGSIKAKYIVHATHIPKGSMHIQEYLEPTREYSIACKLDGPQLKKGIYWGYLMSREIISLRDYQVNGEHFLIVSGFHHKVGEGNEYLKMVELENFVLKFFDVIEFTHQWSGQYYNSSDLIPMIGRRKEKSNIFLATGFSSDGLTYGTSASLIISDQIIGLNSPYSVVFNPSRKIPLKKEIYVGNNNHIHTYLKDIPQGEGSVILDKGHKIAAYKEKENLIQTCSAICTHLGCIVNWNSAEKTWDCPCHGSRFSVSGDIIEGPALYALEKFELKNLDHLEFDDSINKELKSLDQFLS